MNLLGHVGLSIAIAYSTDTLVFKSARGHDWRLSSSRFKHFAIWVDTNIDYRVVIISSIAADLIDKPLGLWLVPNFVSYNTRSFGHSFLFCLTLLLICVIFRKPWRLNMIIFAVIYTFHLIFDQMWIHREISLWPLYGLGFPVIDSTTFSEYSGNVLSNLYNFYKYPWELTGMLIITLFIIRIILKGNIISFFRQGKVN